MMRGRWSGLFRTKTISSLVFRFFPSLLSLFILCIFMIKYGSYELYPNKSRFPSGQFHRCCQSLLLQAECLHHLLSSLFCDGCCWYYCIICLLLAQDCWYQKTKQMKCRVTSVLVNQLTIRSLKKHSVKSFYTILLILGILGLDV